MLFSIDLLKTWSLTIRGFIYFSFPLILCCCFRPFFYNSRPSNIVSNVHGKELSHIILVPENRKFFLTYKQRKPLIMRRIKRIYNRNK